MPSLLLSISLISALVHGYNNGVGKLPYMGWNTWCTDGRCGLDVCNSDEIKQIANAMIQNGMYDAGYRYINLDDCWSACNRTSNGSLYAEPTRFPQGMSTMIEYIHNLQTPIPGDNLKFGLYTSAGEYTCSAGLRAGCRVPGSEGYFEQDANTFAAWKVDLVKADACYRNKSNPWETLQIEFSTALNKSGRSILLELDGGYYLPVVYNISDGPYQPKYSQAWKIVADHHDNWNNTKQTIRYVAQPNVTDYSGSYNWAYADLLMTGGQGCANDSYDNDEPYVHCAGQSDIEYMTEFSFFAISGSPLLVATDIRNMTDIMKKVLLNTEIIAVNQQDETKAGKLNYYYDCEGKMSNDSCQIWTRELKENGTMAVLVINIDDDEREIDIEFDRLGMNGWDNSTVVSIRDLWEHEDIGSFMGSYSVNVVPHGNFFLKLTEK